MGVTATAGTSVVFRVSTQQKLIKMVGSICRFSKFYFQLVCVSTAVILTFKMLTNNDLCNVLLSITQNGDWKREFLVCPVEPACVYKVPLTPTILPSHGSINMHRKLVQLMW